jgi:hypothetical protein
MNIKLALSSLTIATLASFSTSASAQSNISLQLLGSSNTFEVTSGSDSIEEDLSSNGFKIGYWGATNSSGQWGVSYQLEGFEQGIYDESNESLHYFSAGYRNKFFTGTPFVPYIGGEVGLGVMGINEDIWGDSNSFAIGGKIGGGVAYAFSDRLAATVGLDLQYRSWSPIQVGTMELDLSETSILWSVGLEFGL